LGDKISARRGSGAGLSMGASRGNAKASNPEHLGGFSTASEKYLVRD